MQKRQYERPCLKNLSSRNLPVAEGSSCANGTSLVADCQTGNFAALSCISGDLFTINECQAGAGNIGGS